VRALGCLRQAEGYTTELIRGHVFGSHKIQGNAIKNAVARASVVCETGERSLTVRVVLRYWPSTMEKKRRLALAFVALAVLAILALLALSTGRPSARLPLPNPNGYDDFIKAGGAIVGDVANWPALDHDRLRESVYTNAEALRLLRLGLTRQCAIPMDSVMTNAGRRLNDLTSFKRLAQLLAAEGRLREMDNDPAGAALIYAEIIHFGNETSRGGFVINRLVGIACEAIACSPLAKLVPKLKSDEARSVIKELEKVDSARVTWDEVRRNESRFSWHQPGKAFDPIIWATTRWQRWRPMQRAAARHKRVVVHERLLMTELALRCYQSEKSRLPAALGELVPSYLSKVPEDPFSGRPLIYRLQGQNWLLYSVGLDGSDDGGKPAGPGLSAKGDLFYDSPW